MPSHHHLVLQRVLVEYMICRMGKQFIFWSGTKRAKGVILQGTKPTKRWLTMA